ncbi:MAG: adenylosuccinate lyase [Spirochaetia bacterium]|nr:adenylosuccinate lyase [Spirochaetia bacterium]
MSANFDHTSFISPFTWRYGTLEMRSIYSEVHKRKLLRTIWIAIAKGQMKANLVSLSQVEDLIAHKDDIDIDRASEIEKEIHHDLMAEIKTYAEQCTIGGKIIHLGATSMDVLDNMDVIRQKQALSLIEKSLLSLLSILSKRIMEESETSCMAFTHIQPAEPTTIGYRLSQIGQDLLDDLEDIRALSLRLKGKGIKGAVGTSASYMALLEGSSMSSLEFETYVMNEIGLESFDVATQVYTRKQDYRIGTVLSSLCATLSKAALDIRLLMSPPIGEWSEPFASKQVGSSAMPFKRNPINSEKIDSLCRYASSQVEVLWNNSASMMLERTLDDSANRRIVIPELFLTCDEVLQTSIKLISGLNFHYSTIKRNLDTYGPFAATEKVLMALGKKGADRQVMHERIREHSLTAWSEVQSGKANPLLELMTTDKEILSFLDAKTIISLLDAKDYVGDAPLRAKALSNKINDKIKELS